MIVTANVNFKVRTHGAYLLTPESLTYLHPVGEVLLAKTEFDQELADMVFEDLDGTHITPEEAVQDFIALAFQVPPDWVYDVQVNPLKGPGPIPKGAIP